MATWFITGCVFVITDTLSRINNRLTVNPIKASLLFPGFFMAPGNCRGIIKAVKRYFSLTLISEPDKKYLSPV